MKIGFPMVIEGYVPIGSRPTFPKKPHKERPQEKGAPVHGLFMKESFCEKVIQVPHRENKGKYDTDGKYCYSQQNRSDFRENIQSIAPLWEQL